MRRPPGIADVVVIGLNDDNHAVVEFFAQIERPPIGVCVKSRFRAYKVPKTVWSLSFFSPW